MSARPAAPAARGRAALAACLALLSLALFWPAAGYEFTLFDDPIYVTENKHVLGGIGAEGLRWSLTATAGGSWHPLTWWSHMLDVRLFGTAAGGHHATSVLLHAVCGASLFWLLSGLTGTLWPALAVAGLFALHPLHVESVAWVSERKDVLAALFWMLTLLAYWAYVRRPRLGGYLAVLGMFVLALMSKPMVVTLPLLLLLLDFWPLGRFRPPFSAAGAWRLLAEKVPLLLLSTLAGLVTMEAQRIAGALEPLSEVPRPFQVAMVSMRLMNAVESYLVYLGDALWPAGLAVFYPHPAHALQLWRAVGAGLALAAITVFMVRAARRSPWLTTGWLWYVVTLLPVIGFLQVGEQARADRYTYLPLIGAFVMVAWSARGLLPRGTAWRRQLAVLAAVALVAHGAAAARQLGTWRDQYTLFLHAASVTTDNYLAYRSLGEWLRERGDFVGAERYARREVAVTPGSAGAYGRLARALSGQGRVEEAVGAYLTAVRHRPDDVAALNNLGVQLTALGRFAEADEHLRAALRLSPQIGEIHANMGDNLVGLGRYAEAAASYRRALELNPGLTRVRGSLERLLAATGLE